MTRIGCKDCISTKCEGCNMLTLEKMLNSGKFDCLMDEPHCVNQNAEVGVVKHGRWDDSGRYAFGDGSLAIRCSECGCALHEDEYQKYYWNYCPNCGAKMDGGAENG